MMRVQWGRKHKSLQASCAHIESGTCADAGAEAGTKAEAKAIRRPGGGAHAALGLDRHINAEFWQWVRGRCAGR